MSYTFLQQYWWCIISLLEGLLAFMMFVQGANSLVFSLTGNEQERRLIFNSTGRKWELTFTILVTYGGAFFASFPLFYSTSFSGAYWVWMIILFTFVLQAVSYELQYKVGNFLKPCTFQICLVINGVLAPLLLGMAIGTFFNGANFTIDRTSILGPAFSDASHVSMWTSSFYGLDALQNIWNWIFGLAFLFLARTLGCLYIINNVEIKAIRIKAKQQARANMVPFLVFFCLSLGHLACATGYGYDPATGIVSTVPYKYMKTLFTLWPIALMIAVGTCVFIFGSVYAATCRSYRKGIWGAGLGAILNVWALGLLAGFNNTVFYPSIDDPQSGLTIANSCSSEFTLRTMFVVSLAIPIVLAYIVYAWYKIDKRKITAQELEKEEHY